MKTIIIYIQLGTGFKEDRHIEIEEKFAASKSKEDQKYMVESICVDSYEAKLITIKWWSGKVKKYVGFPFILEEIGQ